MYCLSGNHNTISLWGIQMRAEYIDHLGTDLTVVNSARVSFDKESEWERTVYKNADKDGNVESVTYSDTLSDRDYKLVRYLAKHNHWTPFSHCMVTMRETVPIFVARQRFKHMVGFAYNEVSRRYVDDEPEFFTPEKWRKRPDGSVKQGSGEFFSDKDQDLISKEYRNYLEFFCEDIYKWMLDTGVAPEQARMVLPQSMYTSYYVTGSLAAWARAYKQRIDAHAQKEIQDLAKEWDKIIKPLFPVSWAALTQES